jgi:hypothetical protein
MAEDLAAALAEERAILAAAADAADQRAWRIAAQIYGTLKAHALLAAVEAALKLADEWEQEGVDPSWQLTNEDAAAGLAAREHSSALQGAITAVLTRADVPRT